MMPIDPTGPTPPFVRTAKAAVSVKDGLGSPPIPLTNLEAAVANLLRYAPADAVVTFVDDTGEALKFAGPLRIVATWPEDRSPRE
jgi:hypothetical protein